MHHYYIAIGGLSGSTTFLHTISQTARFSGGGRGEFIVNKMCFDCFYNFVWNISYYKKNSAKCYQICT